MEAAEINFFDALEEREACREMAGTAEVVRCTYFVTSPIPSGSDRVYIAGSFRQAFEHWCQDGSFRISAIFEWKVGDEEGRGTVRYVNPGAILVRYGFVEQTIK
ncbi:MAG TPA: hypothetical protein VEV84_16000, partial [Pyrinomonadaceae bacterium]|nr:hypothetical protein [Pyrinomonadaceae bacterium]